SGSHRLSTTLSFFFLHYPPPTETYTLSLHDALPISRRARGNLAIKRTGRLGCSERRFRPGRHAGSRFCGGGACPFGTGSRKICLDRKSTRLNSSHVKISYAVFCLKKKKKNNK